MNEKQKVFTQDHPALDCAHRQGRQAWKKHYALPYGCLALFRKMLRKLRINSWKAIRSNKVNLGDLGTTTPVSLNFGYDRGLPIDRFYIERFLEQNRERIRGRVLEVGDAIYSKHFGGDQVTEQDILFLNNSNPEATIIGDLSDPAVLPSATFDCIVLTQTFQLVFDVHESARQLFRSLKPGGTLLLTVPGISPIDRGEWRHVWYWSFTSVSARKLFAGLFGEDNVTVEEQGNVLAATAFLQGLAFEEMDQEKLLQHDPAFPVLVSVVARKSGAAP